MQLAAALALLAASLGGPGRLSGPTGAHGWWPAGGVCELGAVVDRRATASRRCLTCHDGSSASSAVPGRSGPLGQHPVDADYAAARERRRHAKLRDARELGPALPLVGGKVTCTTCHAGDSRERAHVALPMAGSALCFGCHAL